MIIPRLDKIIGHNDIGSDFVDHLKTFNEFSIHTGIMNEMDGLFRGDIEGLLEMLGLDEGKTALTSDVFPLPFDKCLISFHNKHYIQPSVIIPYDSFMVGVIFVYVDKEKGDHGGLITFTIDGHTVPVFAQKVLNTSKNSLTVLDPYTPKYILEKLNQSLEVVGNASLVIIMYNLFILNNPDLFDLSEPKEVKHTSRVGPQKKRKDYKTDFIVINKKASTPSSENLKQAAKREFMHRFEVRGHWRKVKRFGHDQNGNLIQGKTWVRPCIKGPENKPLIKKPRVMIYD